MTVVAVTGTGYIGPVHVEALRRIGITVRGILGSTPEKSRQAAQQLGLEIGYSDFQAILDDPQVTAVHLTTPNHLHFKTAKAALLAGKHVVCEKPLAMTTTETSELVKIARELPHLISAVHYNIRYYPLIFHARELIQSGAIGDIYLIRGGYVQDWLLYDTDFNWRVLRSEGGDARAIGDIGTHWMDLMGFITGLRIESLLADLQTFVPVRKKPKQAIATFKGKETLAPSDYIPIEIDTEDYGAVLFHYQGGARGTMNVSQVSPGRKNFLSFEISGSKGSLAWDSENPNHLWIGYRDRPNEILVKDPSLFGDDARAHTSFPGGHAEGYPDTVKQLYRDIYNYIQTGDFDKPRPFPTFEDGHYEIMLCESILKSHQERRWVDISGE
jgi:predicted dehydrogenase